MSEKIKAEKLVHHKKACSESRYGLRLKCKQKYRVQANTPALKLDGSHIIQLSNFGTEEGKTYYPNEASCVAVTLTDTVSV